MMSTTGDNISPQSDPGYLNTLRHSEQPQMFAINPGLWCKSSRGSVDYGGKDVGALSAEQYASRSALWYITYE